MLRVRSLVAHYGQVRALKGLSLHVGEGEIVTLVGANGAGKTTTLNAIAGVHRPTEGAIEFLGRDIAGMPPAQVVRGGISLVPEARQIFSSLSVRDNLLLGAYTRRAGKHRAEVASDLEFVWETFPVLHQREHQKGGTLSGGEQQMLAISRALMARPKLLLLDEPSMGLAPQVVRDIFRVLELLNRNGMTMLLVEQNARMALRTAHRGYVMETGRVVLEGKSDFLLHDREVQRAYLGKGYRTIEEA
jgi:branched-chain amino acid transport system ATP-binding protein